MSAKPRVLLLSASSGAGHVRAAQALEKAFTARGDCVIEHIDAIRYVSKLFQRVYDKAYIAMVRRVPELMGVLYDRTDQPWNHPRRRLALDRLNTQPMIRMLKRMQPDICVATHFLPAEIIGWLIARQKLAGQTRHRRHRLTMFTRCGSAVPSIATTSRSRSLPNTSRESASRAKNYVSPAFPSIRHLPYRSIVLPHESTFSLDPDAPTCSSPRAAKASDPSNASCANCWPCKSPGRLWPLPASRRKCACAWKRSRGRGITAQRRAALCAVGFTTEMDQYMAAADLLVGKAGGLTTSEALARALPMALVEPIPGQEERNSDHLLEAGAAIRCNNLPAAAWKIAALLDDPARLHRMQDAARVMARPNAAAAIAEDAVRLVDY